MVYSPPFFLMIIR